MGKSEESVASARELYEREPTFRAGVLAWVADRRCDLRLVDLLLEYGLTTQAECARWAATEPDRMFFQDRKEIGAGGPLGVPLVLGGYAAVQSVCQSGV
jgi:hypothetical protein